MYNSWLIVYCSSVHDILYAFCKNTFAFQSYRLYRPGNRIPYIVVMLYICNVIITVAYVCVGVIVDNRLDFNSCSSDNTLIVQAFDWSSGLRPLPFVTIVLEFHRQDISTPPPPLLNNSIRISLAEYLHAPSSPAPSLVIGGCMTCSQCTEMVY